MFKKAFRVCGFVAAAAMLLALSTYRCSGSEQKPEESPEETVEYDPDTRIGGRALRFVERKM